MGGDLSSQWEVASRLQIEVERHKRMENDYRRDLAQKNAVIEDLRTELKAKTGNIIEIYISGKFLIFLNPKSVTSLGHCSAERRETIAGTRSSSATFTTGTIRAPDQSRIVPSERRDHVVAAASRSCRLGLAAFSAREPSSR